MSVESDRYRRAHELFRRAVELGANERRALLERECAGDAELRREVDGLLEADSAFAAGDNAVDDAVRGGAAAALARELGDQLHAGAGLEREPPASIGGYRIVREIGRGGMGSVYEAQQDAPLRRVAIKAIRRDLADPELVRRLEREAELLGRLQDPGIAHIYEAGLDAEQPFLVMEYIEGRTLDVYARDEGLDANAKLELVARVCDAVHYAHEVGIVHRDLKPANVLVDRRGQPKVLDFGIATVRSPELQLTTLATAPGQIVGTLPYMSPEQVAGDSAAIDARADVYALGAVLFELLSGRRPHDLQGLSLPEAARVLRDDEPTRLSSIATEFRGDVETIVSKALEKERERRYASAADLAADLRRYLRGEPIVARPSSAFYQLRKFAARNRMLVAAFGLLITALTAGFVVSTALYLSAEQARSGEADQAERAQYAAGKASALNEVLIELLTMANPLFRPGGEEMRVSELLDAATANLEKEPPDHEEVAATLHQTIGVAYSVLGRYGEARVQLTRALELRTELFGADHADALESRLALAQVYADLGEHERARELCEFSLEAARRTLGDQHAVTADAYSAFASVATLMSEYDLAEEYFQTALSIRRELGEAAEVYREAHRVFLDAFGEVHPLVANSFTNRARLAERRGELERAEELMREALRRWREMRGDRHPQVASVVHNLASIAQQRGRADEARALFAQALDVRREYLGTHTSTAESAMSLADLERDRGELELAEALLREAIAMRREVYGPGFFLGVSLGELGDLLSQTGRLDEAVEAETEGLAMLDAADSQQAPYALRIARRLLRDMKALGQLEGAEQLAVERRDLARELWGPSHDTTRLWEQELRDLEAQAPSQPRPASADSESP